MQPLEGWGGGGKTPGKVTATYADLKTGIMVVTTHCGSLSAVFTWEGGACKLYTTLADAYVANNMTRGHGSRPTHTGVVSLLCSLVVGTPEKLSST